MYGMQINYIKLEKKKIPSFQQRTNPQNSVTFAVDTTQHLQPG
jgi:hypothetical protein